MKLATKTIATLLAAASIAAAVPGISQLPISRRRRRSQFDALLQRHDRKGEIRAELLGMEVADFRRALRTQTLEQIIISQGLRSKRTFRIALVGMLRDELLQRGWTRARIDRYVMIRALRMA
ncbi:MAG: hypothetical protein KA604_04185 [Candidatus Saccharimonas sp.]|nr:hypothetical protein [Candidatus Saccharimonas sp.]